MDQNEASRDSFFEDEQAVEAALDPFGEPGVDDGDTPDDDRAGANFELLVDEDKWTFGNLSEESARYHEGFPGRRLSPAQVTLRYNTVDAMLLNRVQREGSLVLKRARKELGKPDGGCISPIDALALCLPPDLVRAFLDLVKRPAMDLSQLCEYLAGEIALRWFQMSIKSFSESNIFKSVGAHLPELDTVANIQRDLRAADTRLRSKCRGTDHAESDDNDDAVPSLYTFPEILERMQLALNQHFAKHFFVPGRSWCDLDDDKLPHQSLRWEDLGIKRIPTKSKKCQPVVHLVASIGTTLVLNCTVETLRITVAEIVTNAVLQLFGRSSPTNLNMHHTEKLVLLIDRGYLAFAQPRADGTVTNIIQALGRLGVKVLGTIKRTGSFPFDEGVPPDDAGLAARRQVMMPKGGQRTTFSAVLSSSGGSILGPQGKVMAMMMRQGHGKTRVTRLATNFIDFMKNEWVYETSSGGVSRIPHKDSHVVAAALSYDADLLESDDEGEETSEDRARLTTQAFVAMDSGIYRFTVGQRSPDWFLSRKFRSSSTNTHAALNCVDAVFIDTDELKELHRAVKATACLSPRKSITLESASEHRCEGEGDESNGGDQRGAAATGRPGRCFDTTKEGFWVRWKKDVLQKVCKARTLPASGSRSSLIAALAGANLSVGEACALAQAGGGELKGSLVKFASANENFMGTTETGTTGAEQPPLSTPSDDDSINEVESVATEKEKLTAFLQVMVPRWFMTPLESASANPAKSPLRLGSKSEDLVTSTDVIHRYLRRYSGETFSIQCLRHYGLVARRDSPFAATSPDGVVALCSRSSSGMRFSELAALEVKTSTTSATGALLFARSREQGRFVECTAGSVAFKKYVPNASYRTQIVHHAVVLGLNKTLVVYIRSGVAIEQMVLVSVTREDQKTWRDFLKALETRYMGFAFAPNASLEMPRLGLDGSAPYAYAVEHHTAEVWLRLWRCHHVDVIQNGTPPRAARIVPLMTSAWNKMMGNVDTVRGVIESAKPAHVALGPAAILWNTFLNYVLYNSFRLWQLDHVGVGGWETYTAYREARKRSKTYRGFLEMLMCDLRSQQGPEALSKFHHLPATNTTPVAQATHAHPRRSEVASDLPVVKQNAIIFANTNADAIKLRMHRDGHLVVPVPRVNGKPPATRCILCCANCSNEKEHAHRIGRRSAFKCSVCNVVLCKKGCWATFHSELKLPYPSCMLAGPSSGKCRYAEVENNPEAANAVASDSTTLVLSPSRKRRKRSAFGGSS